VVGLTPSGKFSMVKQNTVSDFYVWHNATINTYKAYIHLSGKDWQRNMSPSPLENLIKIKSLIEKSGIYSNSM